MGYVCRAMMLGLALLTAACGMIGGGRRPLPPPAYSPVGEPLVGGNWPKDCEDALDAWFDRVDPGGRMTLAELTTEAERQFRVMDTRHDGKLTSASLSAYRSQAMGRQYGVTGALEQDWDNIDGTSRSARRRRNEILEAMPAERADPVMSADANLDGSVTWDEFRLYIAQSFAHFDQRHSGAIGKPDIHELCH